MYSDINHLFDFLQMHQGKIWKSNYMFIMIQLHAKNDVPDFLNNIINCIFFHNRTTWSFDVFTEVV